MPKREQLVPLGIDLGEYSFDEDLQTIKKLRAKKTIFTQSKKSGEDHMTTTREWKIS